MSFIQRLVCTIVPKRLADEIEAESRSWRMTCADCHASHSVWDAGGVRWKAKGSPRVRAQCAACGQIKWHEVAKSTGV